MKIKKILADILCISMVFGNLMPAFAATTETDVSTYENTAEDISKETDVLYQHSASYFVTIPKTIVLGSDKQSAYSVKVEGDIPSDKEVYVSPIDGIADTEDFDFYMHDRNTDAPKDDVIATVTQKKFYWNFEDVADAHMETDNKVAAGGLSSGTWQGTFNFEISMRMSPSHIHSYEENITKEAGCTETGEKTLTCACGDTKTEVIPATGHNYVNGKCTECNEADPEHEHNYGDNDRCTDCGALNPDHQHGYTENVTKEASCTEAGEKTLTCACGDIKTEAIPATRHTYAEDNICTQCGQEAGPYDIGTNNELNNWNYTLDETNKIVTLNYYTGSDTDVIVYANYLIGSDIYETRLASYKENGTSYSNYLFAKRSNVQTIKFSENIDTSNVTNMSNMFYDCSSLTSLDVSGFNTGNVTNMNSMFDGCNRLRSLDLSNFDTSKVTNMVNMFYDCERLASLDLSSFDTGRVTSMQKMFYYCRSLTNLDLSSFDTGNVTDMSNMFYYCVSLTSLDLSSFDTGRVTNMSNMFYYCNSLTSLDLSSFNTSQVTNMSRMFYDCLKKITSLDLSNFDTGSVTDMSGMFANCTSLTNLDIGSFDTGSAKTMNGMFGGCSSLTSLDLSSFDTGNVTDMTGMFANCSSLASLNLSNFDTGKATLMTNMFSACTSLTSLDISNFNTGNVTNMSSMFEYGRSLTSLDLSSFNTGNVTDMRNMFHACYALKSVYASGDKWSTSQAAITGMFENCGTSSVTYK